MSLEEAIQKNTEALEANTAALLKAAAAPKPVKEKKAETAETPAAPNPQPGLTPQVGPSLQEMRDVAAKIVDAGKGPEIERIAKKHGLKRVSEAHGTDKAGAVWDDLNQVHEAIKSAAAI